MRSALATFRERECVVGEAEALRLLGSLRLRLGDEESGRPLLLEAVRRFRALKRGGGAGSPYGLEDCLRQLGDTLDVDPRPTPRHLHSSMAATDDASHHEEGGEGAEGAPLARLLGQSAASARHGRGRLRRPFRSRWKMLRADGDAKPHDCSERSEHTSTRRGKHEGVGAPGGELTPRAGEDGAGVRAATPTQREGRSRTPFLLRCTCWGLDWVVATSGTASESLDTEAIG